MRGREKEERSWREGERVSATERGQGVVVGRGGGEEEVWRATGGRFEDAVTGSEWRKLEEAGARSGLLSGPG